MAILGSLSVNVLANTAGFSRGMDTARTGISRLRGGIGGLGSSLASFAGKAGPLAAATAGLVGLGSAAMTLKKSIGLAADYEQLEVAFGTMLGSGEKAKTLLDEISDFSASTPFQFPDIAAAGKTLLAFGTDAGDVVPTLGKLGDVASGIDMPLNRMVAIFGKIQSGGKLTGETLNQLAEGGVPVIRELADQFNVAESEVRGLVSAGKIGSKDIEQMFTNLTGEGGQFNNMMEAQSGTLSGLWSTLTDNINLALTTVGTKVIEAFDLKAIIGNMTGFVQNTLPGLLDVAIEEMVSWIDWLRGLFGQVRTFFEEWKPVFIGAGRVIISYVTFLKEAFVDGWNAIADAVATGTDKVLSYFGMTGTGVNQLKETLVTGYAIAEFAFDNWREVIELGSLKALHSIVSFANKSAFVFTDQLPAFLGVAGDFFTNEFARWIDLAAATGDAIKKAITLQGISFDFSNINEMYDRAMMDILKDVPKMSDRIAGEFESSLASQIDVLETDLGIGLEEHIQNRLAEMKSADDKTKKDKKDKKDKGAEFDLSGLKEFGSSMLDLGSMLLGATGEQDSKGKLSKAMEKGSAEAISLINQSRFGANGDVDEKQLKEMQDTATGINDLVNIVKAKASTGIDVIGSLI